jgi:ferredoxin
MTAERAGGSVAATKLFLVNFPEAIDEREQGENYADTRDDEETQDEIDQAQENRAIDGVWNCNHN